MRRMILIAMALVFSLVSTGCGSAATPLPATPQMSATPSQTPSPVQTPSIPSSSTPSFPNAKRKLTIALFDGPVEYLKATSNKWVVPQTGQWIFEGDQLRTAQNSYVSVQINDQSGFILGPQSQVSIDEFTLDFENSRTTLNLQSGSLLAVALKKNLGMGGFEIITAQADVAITASQPASLSQGVGLASLIDFPADDTGSLIVKIQQGTKPEETKTQVGCLSGNATVRLPNDKQTALQAGQYIEVVAGSGSFQPISPDLQEEASHLGAMKLDVLINILTGIPPVTPFTSTASITPSRTLTPTKTGQTSTRTPILSTPVPVPTHRITTPDPNATARPDGLTDEEAANAGHHKYFYKCLASGSCGCSSPTFTLDPTITFAFNSVTLEGNSVSITFPKQMPNTYVLINGNTITVVVFYIDGFEYTVTKSGKTCMYQDYFLQ